MVQDDLLDLEMNSLKSDTDDENDNEDINEDDHMESTRCLFCEDVFCSLEKALKHLEIEHDFHLNDIKAKFKMNHHSFINLINCIRKNKITPNYLLNAKEPFWNDEKYFKPVEYEPWMNLDFEEMEDNDIENIPKNTQNNLEPSTIIEQLKEKCDNQELLLENAMQDMTIMRSAYLRLVNDEKFTEQNHKSISNIPSKNDADDAYFNSYAHFHIHLEMLSDTVRTSSYRDAFFLNKKFFHEKDVLDVGCGTGVLSLFVSQAGAKNVVGIDNSEIIYNAMDIVKKNNSNNISLIKGRLEDTELPIQKYDVIISEWMGYFLFFEGMLDTMLYARENHLKENGIILPNRCSLSLIGYGDEDLFKKHVTFWDNVYGLDMSSMKKEVLKEPLIEIVNKKYILTNSNTITEINMLTVDKNYSNFSYDFNLKCIESGNLNSIVGYFDVSFDLPHKIAFETGPFNEPTHWKQVVFFLKEPHAIKKDDIVNGNITCRRSRQSLRSLDIIITLFGEKLTYYLD